MCLQSWELGCQGGRALAVMGWTKRLDQEVGCPHALRRCLSAEQQRVPILPRVAGFRDAVRYLPCQERAKTKMAKYLAWLQYGMQEWTTGISRLSLTDKNNVALVLDDEQRWPSH